MNVKTEEELASAIEKNENIIIIEGDLANKTLRIKAAGTVAWGLALGSISIAFVVVIAFIRSNRSDKTTATISAISLAAAGTGAAFSILGPAATSAAVSMAVYARNLSVLKKIRGDYKIKKISEGVVVLSKK